MLEQKRLLKEGAGVHALDRFGWLRLIREVKDKPFHRLLVFLPTIEGDRVTKIIVVWLRKPKRD